MMKCRELYGLFHVPESAMPRDQLGRLVSPWNKVNNLLKLSLQNYLVYGRHNIGYLPFISHTFDLRNLTI